MICVLVVAGACVQVKRAPAPFTATAIAEARAADTSTMPASCRFHGGVAPVRPALPILRLGQRTERKLDSLGRGELWVRIYAVESGDALNSGFSLEPFGLVGGIERVDRTWVRMREPAGAYHLRIITWPNDWRDSINVRRGFADTLILGLGHRWMCNL